MFQLTMVLTSFPKAKRTILASLVKQGGQNQKDGLKYIFFLKLVFFDLEEWMHNFSFDCNVLAFHQLSKFNGWPAKLLIGQNHSW